jgi:heptosyltransferase-3
MTSQRALFLKTKHIGDSIVLTSAIEALPPNFQVDVLCFKDSEAIFKMHPRVRHVYLVPRYLKGVTKLVAYVRIYKDILSESYDLVAQFSDDWRGAFLTRLLKPKLSVARNTLKRPSFWKNSFHCLSKIPPKGRHAAEQDVDLLRRVGLYSQAHAPAYRLEVSDRSEQKVNEWINHLSIDGKRLVLIHAAARWKFKGLSNSTWVNVINQLHQEGYQIILSGGASDRAFNQAIVDACEQPPFLTEKFSLEMTAALMKKARLLISIDSMAIHMASAMQLPVVAIFGPTNEKIWSPWAVSSKIVALDFQDSPSFSCRPCGLDGCAGSKVSQCLYAIPASNITKAALNFLTE